MQYVLKSLTDTVVKARPVDSTLLLADEKDNFPAGKVLKLHSFRFDEPTQHLKFAILDGSIKGKNTWYAFGKHVQVLLDGKVLSLEQAQPKKPTIQGTVKLDVPYLSQLDNVYNPTGSCNVTSLAMCMAYFGHPTFDDRGVQLEDELYLYCQNNGLNRHSPTDLAYVMQQYGYKDNFTTDALWEDVKKWLNGGNPVITHGYFTKFGHIVVIVGYSDTGWIANDPYGEWTPAGYDTYVSGEALTYSYSDMDKICAADGQLWIHYVSK